METERVLDKQDLPSQCLKLGEEAGQLFRAVRKQGTTQNPVGASPTSGTKPPITARAVKGASAPATRA
jgi:hypothetical protein